MNIIEITSGRHTSDWYQYDKNKIDLDKIYGFEICHRGSWHVRVIPKNNEGFEYELGHWVENGEIKKLINNYPEKIVSIKNTHMFNNFTEVIKFITK